MKAFAILCVVIAAAQAKPYFYHAPAFDSAVVQSDRVGGNFAYSVNEAKAFAAPFVPVVAAPAADAAKVEIKSVEAKPFEFKPFEFKSYEFKPVEFKAAEYKPVEYKPVEFKAGHPYYYSYGYPFAYPAAAPYYTIKADYKPVEYKPASGFFYSYGTPYAGFYPAYYPGAQYFPAAAADKPAEFAAETPAADAEKPAEESKPFEAEVVQSF